HQLLSQLAQPEVVAAGGTSYDEYVLPFDVAKLREPHPELLKILRRFHRWSRGEVSNLRTGVRMLTRGLLSPQACNGNRCSADDFVCLADERPRNRQHELMSRVSIDIQVHTLGSLHRKLPRVLLGRRVEYLIHVPRRSTEELEMARSIK